MGWAASAKLLSVPVKLTLDGCSQLTTLLSKNPNLQGQTGHGQGELEKHTSTKWPGLVDTGCPGSEGLWSLQRTSLPRKSEEGECV